jgi:hypothetical protein
MLQGLARGMVQDLKGLPHLQKRAVKLSGDERLALIGVTGGFLSGIE